MHIAIQGPVNYIFFFFQAEDGIRDHCVTGVQTCALPIFFVNGTLGPPPWIVLPTGCGPKVPLTKRSVTHPWAMRNPSRPPYSNQPWLPIVGTTVPSPVTVATMPECAANDCT